MTHTENKGKRILVVIAQEHFRDEECFISFEYPASLLRGWKTSPVTVVK